MIEEPLCCSNLFVTKAVAKSYFISPSRSHLPNVFLQGKPWAWFPAPAEARKLARMRPLHPERHGPRGLVDMLSGSESFSLRKILWLLTSCCGGDEGICSPLSSHFFLGDRHSRLFLGQRA